MRTLLTQLRNNFKTVLDNYKASIIFSQGYNVTGIQCVARCRFCCQMTKNQESKFSPASLRDCRVFVGITTVQAKKGWLIFPTTIILYFSHKTIVVPFQRRFMFKLKPLKVDSLNVEQLYIANHKFNQYSRDLDYLIKKPFITRYSEDNEKEFLMIAVSCML